MKYTVKNLLKFISNEKMIFILTIICVITSSFIINFSYGLYQNFHIVKEEEESELYSFEVTFNNDISGNFASKSDIKKAVLSFSDDLNNAIDMYFVKPYTDEIPITDYNAMYIRFCVKNGKIAPCQLFIDNMKKYGTLVSGNYFSEEEEATGQNVALVFDDIGSFDSFTEKIMIDDETIVFQGKKYKIIGLQKMHPLIVPFESLNDDTPIDLLLFNFKNPLTRSQYNEIKEKIQSNIGDLASIPELNIPEPENYYLYNTIIFISALIAILAAINFAILYQYVLTKRRKTLSIFRICGCTITRAFKMLISECMIITIPTFVLTSLIFDKTALPILSKYFEYIESAYSIKLYLLIFVIYVFFCFIILSLMICLGYLRKSINTIWRSN